MSKYHEMYGWMPRDIISKIPEIDRKRMFIDFLLREPSNAGKYIAFATLSALGEKFFTYLAGQIIEGFIEDGENPTQDEVVEAMKDLVLQFTKDPNLMMEYIEEYDPNIQYDINEEETKPETEVSGIITKEQLKDLEDAGWTVVPSMKTFEKVEQPRDLKTGRFMKKS